MRALFALGALTFSSSLFGDSLEEGFRNPPIEARTRAYWWWLNGNGNKESITRDLVEMKTKGMGGALICDAGGADQQGNAQVPHGPTFLPPEWPNRVIGAAALSPEKRLTKTNVCELSVKTPLIES